ncbi:phage tail protein [Lactiplantibacillus argentoratensis]|uniref:phage tail protein n=1 Tax=Lactiplantibacillus argentoratensis TaxID=271881 RepID=UPI001C11DE82|nr:phage tail protein [Lactiplantibacillus argentoratensis]MBU5277276.1 phage tail protein [Lactiplantibacillus argentoratensis]
MAESNATQVILTDDGIKIIKAQNTADNAAGGVENLNDPNLMSVIEKQNNIGQFAGLTSQYNVLIQNAKDDGIDTTAVTTAYNNLNEFMADVLADPSHASDIDRVTYKKYQDAYNEELAKIQSALQNNANNKFTSAASASSQAASTASEAFSAADSAYSKAQSIGNQVDSEIAVTSTATAKAQSAADSASSQAIEAINTGNVASQAVTDLKDGSTMTIAQLANGLGDKVSNSEYASYKWQTASQIGELVTDGAFSAYQQTTKDLISSKVSNSAFSSYKDETASAISSKVEFQDFKTYKEQTDRAFENTVSSADYKSDMKETDGLISSKVSKKDANNVNLIPYSAMPESDNLQWFGTGTGGTLSATTHAFYHNGADSLYELSTASSTEVFANSPRFKINANTTYTFQLKGFASSNVSSMDVFVLGRPNGNTSDYTVAQQIITGIVLSNSALDYRTVTFTTGAIDEAYLRIDNNGSTDGKISILGFTELKLEPGDTATEYIYSGQDSMTSQLSDDINLRVKKGDVANQFNLDAGGALLQTVGSNTKIVLSAPNIIFDTDKPVIIPSANIEKVLVRKQLQAADISANTFTTNNGTFTVYKDGSITAKNMTLVGGKLTSPTINASTINGSTINGTTFHGGGIINNSNNTASYYPMTITPDGAYKSTYFDNAVGLQSSVESGAINYKYRSMIGNGGGQYLAYDSAINGQGFESHSGYTSVKDATFSNTETITGYVNVTPSTGIYLYGPTQKINFAGNADNIGSNGVTMDAYGNIYAQANSAYWRIRDINGNEVANFGIDTANQRDISLYRDTQVGNLFLGVGHTIGMLDKQPLYFKQGDSSGNMLDIKAGAVHYTSLVKSSLLSVKKDVQKADTAYWAQLVNSIDLATYQYKSDDNTSHLRLSSIVDDVNDTKQWQLPDVFINRDENGKLSGVDDSVLLNATLATVQEQQKEIDQLNGHNMELEARLNKLEAKLNG